MPDPSPEALTVAVTGAGGALGQALLRRWHRRGARLIALSHGSAPLNLTDPQGQPIPLRQVQWQTGKEAELAQLLEQVDVLVLNHGINVHGDCSADATTCSLEVNALSTWRLLELFAAVAERRTDRRGEGRRRPEVWVNTSEAEIQPALSPLYELSKRLLGQLLSLRAPELSAHLRLRRLVLGPFRSALNPIGVMDPEWVAGQILRQADWNWRLIIVTPNPLTYVLMPLATVGRWAYVALLRTRSPGR
jgi:nucleoside-diphosphate-sugar epimerase